MLRHNTYRGVSFSGGYVFPFTPPLPWNKRINSEMEYKPFRTNVQELLELVKELRNRVLESELMNRLPSLPTNKRQSFPLEDLKRILESFRERE